MATTVAQPGTALRKIARKYAKQAGLSVDQYLSRLRRLNPDYNRKQGTGALRLGKGVKGPANKFDKGFDSDQFLDDIWGGGSSGGMGGGGSAAPVQEELDVLDSPLYTQTLKDYYLADYLPGLTQSIYDINAAQNELQYNEGMRSRERGEAVRRIAGDYAARGMRSPGAINKDRSQVQSQFADLTRADQNEIQALQNARDIMYGSGAQDAETFVKDPIMFGSVGAGARRDALGRLQQLPAQYNLLDPSRASSAPGKFKQPTRKA